MEHGDIIYTPFLPYLLADFLHFFLRHFRVGFVLEPDCCTSIGIVANGAGEGHNSPVTGFADTVKQGIRLYGIGGDFIH